MVENQRSLDTHDCALYIYEHVRDEFIGEQLSSVAMIVTPRFNK